MPAAPWERSSCFFFLHHSLSLWLLPPCVHLQGSATWLIKVKGKVKHTLTHSWSSSCHSSHTRQDSSKTLDYICSVSRGYCIFVVGGMQSHIADVQKKDLSVLQSHISSPTLHDKGYMFSSSSPCTPTHLKSPPPYTPPSTLPSHSPPPPSIPASVFPIFPPRWAAEGHFSTREGGEGTMQLYGTTALDTCRKTDRWTIRVATWK